MISLDFDLTEPQNQIDVHLLDKSIILVAHNGYSYTRVLLNNENIEKLINKLNKYKNEGEPTQFDTITEA